MKNQNLLKSLSWMGAGSFALLTTLLAPVEAKDQGGAAGNAGAGGDATQVYDNLYIIQAGEMYYVDEDDGDYAQVGVNDLWVGATSFASDGGTGYVIESDSLWSTNLSTGSYNELSEDWPGATELVWGYNGGNERLWAWQSNRLWKIEESNGDAVQLGTGSSTWTNVTSMAFYSYDATQNDLFIVQGGTLYRANSETGARTPLGPTGGWSGQTTMTAGPGPLLHIVQGGHLYAVDPSDGDWTDLGSGWNDTTSMTSLSGKLYIIDSDSLYAVDPTTGGWDLLGDQDGWDGPTLMSSYRLVLH